MLPGENSYQGIMLTPRRILIVMILFLSAMLGTVHSWGDDEEKIKEEKWIAPNKLFTVFTIHTGYYPIKVNGNREVDTYQLIAIRHEPMQFPGICLARAKYFDVQWSPDSKYVAIFNYYFTHNTDIDVYRIESNPSKRELKLSLIYSRTSLGNPPGKRWINWEFSSWDLKNAVLIIEENNDSDRSAGIKKIKVDLKAKPEKTISYSGES